jgi:hypothetical protein
VNDTLLPGFPSPAWMSLPGVMFRPPAPDLDLTPRVLDDFAAKVRHWFGAFRAHGFFEANPAGGDGDADQDADADAGAADIQAGMSVVAATLGNWAELFRSDGRPNNSSGRGQQVRDAERMFYYMQCMYRSGGASSKVRDVVESAIKAVLPPQLARGVLEKIKQDGSLPSESTLNRYRFP